MPKVAALIGLLAALISMPANAAESPRQLAKDCQTLEGLRNRSVHEATIPNSKAALLCWGYMAAIQDLLVLTDDRGGRILGLCPPENGTLLELIHSFEVFARTHPEDLQGNTAVAVITALRAAYPCSQSDHPEPSRP